MARINPIEKQEAFQLDRRNFIGGSDIGAIMGFGKYNCALRVWRQKRGEKPSHPFWGNQNTERGTILEPVAAKLFAEKYEVQLRKAIPKAHRLYPELRPQSDYEFVKTAGITCQFVGTNGLEDPIVLDDSWGAGVLSIKCPGLQVFKKVQYEGLDEDYIMQLMYELACWNRKWGSYCFFNAENWKIIRFDVKYDPVLGEAAVQAANEFLPKIENGPSPDKLPATHRACGRCEFAPTCQSDALLEMLGKEGSGDGLSFDAKLADLVQIVRMAETEAEPYNDLVDESKEALRKALGDTTAVETTGFRVYFRPQAGRKTFQADPFFKAHPEIPTAERDKFTSTSKPSRPLRIFDIPVTRGE